MKGSGKKVRELLNEVNSSQHEAKRAESLAQALKLCQKIKKQANLQEILEWLDVSMDVCKAFISFSETKPLKSETSSGITNILAQCIEILLKNKNDMDKSLWTNYKEQLSNFLDSLGVFDLEEKGEEKQDVITPSKLPTVSYAEFLKLQPQIFETMEKIKEKLELKEIPQQTQLESMDMTHTGQAVLSPLYCSFMMMKGKVSLEKWPSDSQNPVLIITHVMPVVAFLFSAIAIINIRPELSVDLPTALYDFKVEILNLGEKICLLFDKDFEIFKAKINFGYQKAINDLTFKRFNDERLFVNLEQLSTFKSVDIAFMFEEINPIYQIVITCITEFDNFSSSYKKRLLAIVYNFLKKTIDNFSISFTFFYYRMPIPGLIYSVFIKNTILTTDFLLRENHEESASLMNSLLQIIAKLEFDSSLLPNECYSEVLPALFGFAINMITKKKLNNEISQFIITVTKAFTTAKDPSPEVEACLAYLKSFADKTAVIKQDKDNKEPASSQKQPKTPSVSELALKTVVAPEPSKHIKKQIEALQQQNKDVKGSAKRLTREVQESKKTNKKLQESLNEKDRVLKDFENALETERAQLRSVKWQKTVLERQLEESAQRVTDTSADLAEVQAALEQRDAELQQSKKALYTLSGENLSLRGQLKESQDEAKKIHSALMISNQGASKEITTLYAMVLLSNSDRLKDLEESQQKALEKDQQIAALREQLQNELKKAKTDKQADFTAKEKQFKSFYEEITRLNEVNAQLTQEVARLKPKPLPERKSIDPRTGKPSVQQVVRGVGFNFSNPSTGNAMGGKAPGPSS